MRVETFIKKVLMAELSRSAGKIVDRQCVVFDAENIGLETLSFLKGLAAHVSPVMRHVYPETIGQILVLNLPWYIRGPAKAVLKLFVHPMTQEKIKLLRCSSELLEYIDAEQLPLSYGGSSSSSHFDEGPNHGRWSGGAERDWAESRRHLFPMYAQRSCELHQEGCVSSSTSSSS